ncbi:MAG: succinyl-diaminopimelate desuccinylase [Rhizomicrobium sp.]|jgi:succinyl-diaminopimelate desuccinylase
MSLIDPVALSQALIRCPSVTPEDAGALGAIEAALTPLGFRCERMTFQAPGTVAIDNLYARVGTASPHFCFAGHTDVVPPGDPASWRHGPFAGEISDGVLYGRGAVDMKGAIAAFAAAASRSLAKGTLKGSISLLITGDEEGESINGTDPMLKRLAARGERLDHCLVGEPTATATAGDTIKIGRRGSVRLALTVTGVQGHVAYPQRAINPVPILAEIVHRLAGEPLDQGTEHFEASTLVFTTFDVGNPAGNVSPETATARCAIRFNDRHTRANLIARVEELGRAVAHAKGARFEIEASAGSVPFFTEPGSFIEMLKGAIRSRVQETPVLSTTGGTSDARFIRQYCPVAEVGLPGTTMHKVDESVPVAEIETLTDIYSAILDSYFASPLS